MVRILCLHGVGTNSDILETQIGVRAILPEHYEWHFENGEEECEPAPGVEGVFPPPFLCYHFEPTTENIRDVVELVDSVVEAEGPFDAVLGFSQGGALAATTILRHQILKPLEAPLFRIAVFFGAHLPWSWDDTHGHDITSLLLQGRSDSLDLREWKRTANQSATTKETTEVQLNEVPDAIRHRIQQRTQNLSASGSTKFPTCRRFHPEEAFEKIAIPTVHVYGVKDSYYEQSRALVDLCEKGNVFTIQHGKGHEIPRDPDISQAIASDILKAFTRADLAN